MPKKVQNTFYYNLVLNSDSGCQNKKYHKKHMDVWYWNTASFNGIWSYGIFLSFNWLIWKNKNCQSSLKPCSIPIVYIKMSTIFDIPNQNVGTKLYQNVFSAHFFGVALIFGLCLWEFQCYFIRGDSTTKILFTKCPIFLHSTSIVT